MKHSLQRGYTPQADGCSDGHGGRRVPRDALSAGGEDRGWGGGQQVTWFRRGIFLGICFFLVLGNCFLDSLSLLFLAFPWFRFGLGVRWVGGWGGGQKGVDGVGLFRCVFLFVGWLFFCLVWG